MIIELRWLRKKFKFEYINIFCFPTLLFKSYIIYIINVRQLKSDQKQKGTSPFVFDLNFIKVNDNFNDLFVIL